jgi:hypothetical protein
MRVIPLDDPAIAYGKSEFHNRVADLQAKLRRGDLKMKSDFGHGYLQAVLKALDVPVSSQVLVFSKTSLQSSRIGPRLPRALYHSDDVAVGWVRGGDAIELSAVDARQGVVFYTLNQGASDRPLVAPRADCLLQCHHAAFTLGVPGMMVRSVHVSRAGDQILDARMYLSDDRNPLEHRWGGWYVTGVTGAQHHMGNQSVENPSEADDMDLADGSNVTDLHRYFDTGAYLRPDSDIVSLMVLEHQTRMVNLISRLGWETRIALANGQNLSIVDPIVKELVKYMLFADEAPLKSPIEGNSEYARQFSQQGPRDKQGRSLRDFDLKTRLFRYPCSFLIYSAQFDALPPEALARVYARLHEVLTAMNSAGSKAVLEILAATKANLPESWK